MRVQDCVLCDHTIVKAVTYEVENSITHEKIQFRDLTLHLISAHGYFGTPGHQRLDPLLSCKALGLQS
jgi:hypothetical protein